MNMLKSMLLPLLFAIHVAESIDISANSAESQLWSNHGCESNALPIGHILLQSSGKRAQEFTGVTSQTEVCTLQRQCEGVSRVVCGEQRCVCMEGYLMTGDGECIHEGHPICQGNKAVVDKFGLIVRLDLDSKEEANLCVNAMKIADGFWALNIK